MRLGCGNTVLKKVSSAGFQDHSTASQTLNVCIDSIGSSLRQWPPSPVSFVHRRMGKGIRLASRPVLHRQRFLRALRIRANEARRTSLLAAPPPSASPSALFRVLSSGDEALQRPRCPPSALAVHCSPRNTEEESSSSRNTKEEILSWSGLSSGTPRALPPSSTTF